MGFEEVPEDCVAAILSWTTPWDVCRAAPTCRAFAAAARSDAAWLNFLPSGQPLSLSLSEASRPPPPPSSSSSSTRRAVERLCQGVFFEQRRQKYLLLGRSGLPCLSLSAAAMNIAWGNDPRFWRWELSKSSCFGKVAHLVAVCWLEVIGDWTISLPPGSYSLSWRLKVANPQGGQMYFLKWRKPLSLCASVSESGPCFEKELDLMQLPPSAFEEWFNFEVGKIEMRGKRGSTTQITLHFSIRDIDCSFWKGGLFLDCLTIKPSHCDDKIYTEQAKPILSKVRGRPGVF